MLYYVAIFSYDLGFDQIESFISLFCTFSSFEISFDEASNGLFFWIVFHISRNDVWYLNDFSWHVHKNLAFCQKILGIAGIEDFDESWIQISWTWILPDLEIDWFEMSTLHW